MASGYLLFNHTASTHQPKVVCLPEASTLLPIAKGVRCEMGVSSSPQTIHVMCPSTHPPWEGHCVVQSLVWPSTPLGQGEPFREHYSLKRGTAFPDLVGFATSVFCLLLDGFPYAWDKKRVEYRLLLKHVLL